MAKYSNVIEYNIKTTLDKSGLSQLQNELRQLELSMQRASDRKLLDPGQVVEARQQLKGLNDALSKSFNSSIGMLDLSKLKTELRNCQVDMDKLGTAFQLGGAKGQVAFNNLVKQVGTFSGGIKQSSAAIDKVFTTISNTVRWGVISSGFSQILNSVHQSVDYIKELDESLTQIMLVTDYSRNQMNEFAKSANEAAKALGSTTVGMTNASLVFAQQGYDIGQSQQLAELSVKLANASQQDTATTSDQITAYMNAYGLDKSMEDLKGALDAWAEVANVSAADVQELAIASQKAASTAKTVGVSTDQLNAQIAAIESVTREAPEQIGNGLKTLYARFSDLSLGQTLEDGVDLGKVTSTLNKIGVEVLDTAGQMRSVGDIMEDLMKIWSQLDPTHQAAVAEDLAGKYQISRFEALMSRSDLYDQYLEASQNSAGTLDTMNEERVNSLEGKAKQLQATWEGLISDIVNSDDFYKFIDVLKGFVEGMDLVVDSIGGGTSALLGLGSTLTKVFSGHIANLINKQMDNLTLNQIKAQNMAESPDMLSTLGVMPQVQNEDAQFLMSFVKNLGGQAGNFSQEQVAQYNSIVAELTENINKAALAEEHLKNVVSEASSVMGLATGDIDSIFKSEDEGGLYNVSNYLDLLSSVDAKKLKDLGADVAAEDMRLFNSEIQKVSQLLAELGKDAPFEKIESSAKKAIQPIKDAQTYLEALRDEGAISKDTFNKFSDVLSKLDTTLDQVGKGTTAEDLSKFSQELISIQTESANTVKILEKIAQLKLDPQQLQEYVRQIQQAESQYEALSQIVEQTKRNADDLGNSFSRQLNVQTIVNAASAFGQLAFAINSVKNLGSIWNQDDISTGEKLLQTCVNLGMVIPSMVTSVKSLTTAFSKIGPISNLMQKVSTTTDIAALASANFADTQKRLENTTKALKIAESEKTAAMKKGVIALRDHGRESAQYKKAVQEGANATTKSTKANVAYQEALLANQRAEEADRLAKEKNTIATNRLKMAQMGLSIAFAAVTIAIGATMAAIQADISARQAAFEKAEKAYEEANSAVEEFKETEQKAADFHAMYDSWKKGETSSAELKQKCTELADELDNLGLKALANSQNFDTFGVALDNVISKAKDDDLNLAIAQGESLIKADANTGFAGTEGLDNNIEDLVNRSSTPALETVYNPSTNSFELQETKKDSVSSDMQKFDELMSNLKANPGDPLLVKQTITEVQHLIDETQDANEQELQTFKDFVSSASGILREKESVLQAAENNLAMEAQKSDTQKGLSNLSEKGSYNTQDIMNVLAQGGDASQRAFGQDSGYDYIMQLDEALKLVTDDAQKATLQFAKFLAETYELDQSQIDGMIDSLQKAGVDSNGMINFGSILGEEKGTLDLSNFTATPESTQELLNIMQTLTPEQFKELGFQDSQAFGQTFFEELQVQAGDYNLEDWLMKNQLDQSRDTVSAMVSQATEDQEVDFSQLENVPGLEEYADDFDIFTEKTYQGQSALIEVNEALDQFNYTIEHNKIREMAEDTKDLTTAAEDLKDGAIDENITSVQLWQDEIDRLREAQSEFQQDSADWDDYQEKIEEAEEKIRQLTDDLEDNDLEAKFDIDVAPADESIDKWLDESVDKLAALSDQSIELDINMRDDLLGNVDSLVEAMKDVDEATKLIGEDFIVTAEDAKVLEDVFPGITEAHSITTDGMIQLNQDYAQSAINAAKTDLEADATAQAEKLENMAKYEDTLADNYEQQAQMVLQEAEHHVNSEAETSQFISDTEDKLNNFKTEQQKKFGVVIETSTNNEIGMSQKGAQEMADAFAQGTYFAGLSMNNLQKAASEALKKIQDNAKRTAEAIRQMAAKEDVTAEDVDINTDIDLHGLSSEGSAITVDKNSGKDNESYAWDADNFEDTREDQMKRLQEFANDLMNRAKVSRESSRKYRLGASAIRANAQRVAQDMGSAGQPDTSREPSASDSSGGGREPSSREPSSRKPSEKEEKQYEPKYKEGISEEVDLYEKVNTQLEDMDTLLSKIEKENERLYGDKARANMSKQITLLRREKEIQEEKLAIQKQEYNNIADQLLDYGIEFDSQGFISNYAETLKALEYQVNDFTDQYNRETTEEGQNRLEQDIEGAKAALEDFKTLFKRYDELQGQELQETSNAIEELKNKIEDVRIEAYKASQEAIDNIKKLNDQWAELQGFSSGYEKDSPFRTIIEDSVKLKNIFGGAKDEVRDYYETLIQERQRAFNAATTETERQSILQTIDFYKQQQARSQSNPSKTGSGALDAAFQDMQRLSTWFSNPNVDSNPFGENVEALRAALEEAFDRTIDLAQEAEDHVNDLRDAVLDGYKEIAEDAEKQIDKYDRVIDKLDQISDMTKLVYGEEAYAAQKKIYEQQAKTYMKQGQAQQKMLQILKERYDALSEKDKIGEIGQQILEDMDKMEDKLLDIQKSAAEGFQKAFEAAIKKITVDSTKRLFKGDTDRIADNWERDKTFAETYYDSVQKAGAIDKLRLKYIQLLNDSQNSGLLIQNRIRNSMKEQVKYLEDQNYLSEYNVKFANAQLEILQKQIALENARQNKNRMSLRRDAQGNYNYVYSADQSDINSKQSDLLDSELNAYNMSNENRMNVMSQALAAYQDFISKREALIERVNQGDSEALIALEQLEADFKNNMKAYSEELTDSWSGMLTSLEWLAQSGNENVSSAAEQAADAIMSKNEEACAALGINTDSAVQSVLDNISKLETEIDKAHNQLLKQVDIYQDRITNPKHGVVTLVVDGFEDVDNAIDKASEATAGLTTETNKLQEALRSRDLALADSMKELDEYSRKLGDLQRQDSDLMRQLSATQKQLTQAEETNKNWEVQFADLDQAFQEEREKRRAAEERANSNNNSNNNWNFVPSEPVYTGVDINRVIEVYNGINEGRFSVAPSRRGIIVSAGYTEKEAEAGQKLVNYHYPTWAYGEGMEWNAALDRIKREFGGYSSTFANNSPGGDLLYRASFDTPNNYNQQLARKLAAYQAASGTLRAQQIGFDTGGYTGDWNSKDGKMAVLHQKELVLNASDTQNILNAVDMVRQMADLLKNKIEIPSLMKTNANENNINGETIQQRVEIKAEFPNVSTAEDIKTALLNLADSAYQYSYRTR